MHKSFSTSREKGAPIFGGIFGDKLVHSTLPMPASNHEPSPSAGGPRPRPILTHGLLLSGAPRYLPHISFSSSSDSSCASTINSHGELFLFDYAFSSRLRHGAHGRLGVPPPLAGAGGRRRREKLLAGDGDDARAGAAAARAATEEGRLRRAPAAVQPGAQAAADAALHPPAVRHHAALLARARPLRLTDRWAASRLLSGPLA